MKTIDELMDLDPDNLTNEDIDAIITYERKQRGLFESGIKPIKAEGEKKKLDTKALLAGIVGATKFPDGFEPDIPLPKPKIGRRM